MTAQWVIQRAYDILDSAQPVPFDCGRLCDKKCCKGSEQDGMLLFPGEEKLFKGKEGFEIREVPQGKMLLCSGACDRTLRPIACRIFPFFPYVTQENGNYKISVLKDIRALHYCPLQDVSKDFERTVRIAARNLLRDESCADFLLRLTEDLTDLGNL
ncbi:MAG: hypothetical protein IJO14_04690 [Clostridia bacterium]|nr:hypothetical protein [Clostridia bacterium]